MGLRFIEYMPMAGQDYRGLPISEIKQMLEESGLVFLQAFDEYSNQEPRTDSGRIVVVAQENGKEKQEETE